MIVLSLPPVLTAQNEADDQLQAQHQAMMSQTEDLMKEVESSIHTSIDATWAERAETDAALSHVSAGPVSKSPSVADVEAERLRLKQQLRDWHVDDITIINLTAHAPAILKAVADATMIAEANGLDVEKLTRLYRLGLETIRRGKFVRSEGLLPSLDERLYEYFEQLFMFAWKEQEKSEQVARDQNYRVGLFKLMTFAYLESLLASGDDVPDCGIQTRQPAYRDFGGIEAPTYDCPDPVVDELRRYVDAVRTIQSADADRYNALAEVTLAEQQLATDLLSAVPLVGDAMDLYSVIWNETIAGQCLSPAERTLTAVFVAIPILGPRAVKYITSKSDAAAHALFKLQVMMEEAARIGSESVSVTGDVMGVMGRDAMNGFANMLGMSVDDLIILREYVGEYVKYMDEAATVADDAAEELSEEAAKQAEKWRKSRIEYQTLQDAEANRMWVSSMPAELRDRAMAESRQRLTMNAAGGGMETARASVISGSNIVPAHFEVMEQVAKERGEILVFRSINPNASELIEGHFATKGMSVKGKSADWGPQAGMIPVEQKFSKLGNPSKTMDVDAIAKVADFHDQVADCVAKGICQKMDGMMPDGKKIMTIPGPDGDEIPVLFDGTDYFDPGTGSPANLTQAQLADARPMEVLAVKNADGELVPLTADYDFLAIGDKGDVRSPEWDDLQGGRTRDMANTIDDVNEAVKTRAVHPDGQAYQGGNVVHHGPENWYAGSGGAMSVDPEITVFDPDGGPVLIRRCEADCMRQWCEDTKLCGGLDVCGKPAVAPCMPVDPDRLLKDFFHSKRLEGYNLNPNSAWGWGDYNTLGGWTVDGFVRGNTYAKWIQEAATIGPLARTAMWAGKKVFIEASNRYGYLFECTDGG